MLDEIRHLHATGQPVLVGTSSVEESERLSPQLRDVPHQVLNARHEEAEAAIVARAGEAVRSPSRRTWRAAASTSVSGRRRRAGRPARDRHEPAREPPDRSSVARTRRPAGRSRQLAVLRVARGSAVVKYGDDHPELRVADATRCSAWPRDRASTAGCSCASTSRSSKGSGSRSPSAASAC